MKKVLQQPTANIERLLQHQRYLNYLSRRLLSYLPDEFATKLSVLGLNTKGKKQVLLVSVTSSAWASKLRFYLPLLKRSLCAEAQFSHIQSIKIRVTASNLKELPVQLKDSNHCIYSNHSAKIIEDSAQHIADEGLKSSLLRLSQHISRAVRK
ncbi:MAG: DUF721 domain-containing protein [gamma proteobacterium symbiont of Taylorina sp.]|nr:DUF721 domain-containing protein [gamma proteobacterium symbiont of Taylorina sp.]